MKIKSDAEWYIQMAQDPKRNAFYAELLRFVKEQGIDWNEVTPEQKKALETEIKSGGNDMANDGLVEMTIEVDADLLRQMEEICKAQGYTVEEVAVRFFEEFVRCGGFPWEENEHEPG